MVAPKLPQLVRFLLKHALIGGMLAVVCVSALVGLDVGGFGTLALNSPSGPLALLVLTCGMAVTFASVQMGFAIMFLAE